MHKIGDDTATADPITGEWTEGGPGGTPPATILKSGWMNSVQREIINVLSAASVVPSAAADDQMLTALRQLFPLVVNTMAALRAIAPHASRKVSLKAHTQNGDGGEGFFYGVTDAAPGTYVHNNGTVVVPSGGDGSAAWLRDFTGRAHVDMFGTTAGGAVDCTAAFQAAVGAHLVVDVPAKKYLIAGQVTMPYGGKFYGASRHGTIRPGTGLATLEGGSIIYVTSTSVSPFKYYSGNHFEGLTFYYPNQLRTAVTPTVYPATFTFSTANMSEVLVNNSWHRCQFFNSYIWIDALRGHLDFEFQDLVGCAVNRGIRTDGCGGTDIFRNIRISYYYWCQYSDNAAVYIQANAAGMEIGRSDAVHMDRIYCGSMNIGLKFFVGSVNTASGPYGSITGLSLDGNNYGISAQGTHPIGINIVDAMINSLIYDVLCVAATAASVLSITAGKFWGAKSSNIKVDIVSTLRLADLHFFSATTAAVYIAVDSCDLDISQCRFSDSAAVPLTTVAQCNNLMLNSNAFNLAPVLNNPAATYWRYANNLFLYDSAAGAVPAGSHSGTGTIASGATSTVITHGLTYSPLLGQITIIGGENPTNAVGDIYITAIGATNFTVNVRNDPGASNWDFGWSVH